MTKPLTKEQRAELFESGTGWSTVARELLDSHALVDSERDTLRNLILSGFTYDPGHSDLDDEQPIDVRMTLGDYRKVRNMR